MKQMIEHDHRLNLINYRGLVRASFTLCIKNRVPVFVSENIVNLFIETLSVACKKHACVNWVYVFMPDHLHIVIEGTSEDADLWKAAVLFKKRSGYWFSQNMPTTQWQKDFYDHIHRKERELFDHILYIANNPVRKNLVKRWQEYPFLGSLDNDLNVIIC